MSDADLHKDWCIVIQISLGPCVVRRFATTGQAQTFGDAVGEPTLVVPTSLRIRYDRRAVTLREGEPKYVAAGRGTFAIFVDDEGMWSVDLEAESWDST